MSYYHNATFIDIYVTFMLCLKSWAYWLNLTYSVSCIHDMIVYFIQVKMAKDHHTLTMNLVALIMMYKTKERYLHWERKKVVHFFKKKKNNTINIKKYTTKPSSLSFRLGNPWVSSLVRLRDSNIWGILGGVRRIFLLILAFILALESFNLLPFTSILVRILWNFQGSRRDLVYLWQLRYLGGLFRVKGVRIWEIVNFWVVVDAFRSPQTRVRRDPSNIKGFTPRDVTVVPTYSGKFLCKPRLSLPHPKRVCSLLLGLDCLFK